MSAARPTGRSSEPDANKQPTPGRPRANGGETLALPTSARVSRGTLEELRRRLTDSDRFIIETLEDGEMIGTANLVNIDWKNNHAFHGMMLGPTLARGRGYGRDTVMAVMRYAFDELHLERLDGDIIEYNEGSIRLYLGRCGWKEEGRQRRWHYRQGRYWDKIVVGVTRQDYATVVADTGYWDDES